MHCPKCSTEVYKAETGFQKLETIWWCKICKDEVKEPLFSSSDPHPSTDAELMELFTLGFTMGEAEEIINYMKNQGVTLIKALEMIPNPHSLPGGPASAPWHGFEATRASAIRTLVMGVPLPTGQMNTPWFSGTP